MDGMGEKAVPVPEPRVERFEKLGFGMFIHWGLYSQLGQGEWIQKIGGIPGAEYAKLKESFTASEFDAREIARTAKSAGALHDGEHSPFERNPPPCRLRQTVKQRGG